METNTTMELIALAMNSGLVLVIVQVLKVYALPGLRTSAPWAIPLIASVLGMLSSMVLTKSGIDISPIAGLFTGLASSGAFAAIKEAKFVG